LLQRESVEIDIPGIGSLLIKNDLAAVCFHENLVQQCRGITKRPVSERKLKGDMKLNSTYLNKLTLQEENRKMSSTLGLDMDEHQHLEDQRPKTAKFPSSSFLKKTSFNRSDLNTIERP
jgi:CCDC81 eukaryotic HU domain 2